MAHSDTGWEQTREAAYQALMADWRRLEDGPRERLAKARDLLEYTRRQLKQPGWAASFGLMAKSYDALHDALTHAVTQAAKVSDAPKRPLFDPIKQDASDPNHKPS